MSVREQKADALDVFVKAELVRKKAVDEAKMTKLKALRVAREQEQADTDVAKPAAGKRVIRKTMHLPRPS